MGCTLVLFHEQPLLVKRSWEISCKKEWVLRMSFAVHQIDKTDKFLVQKYSSPKELPTLLSLLLQRLYHCQAILASNQIFSFPKGRNRYTHNMLYQHALN